ncbi:hypothetical protein [Bosea sp. NPDC055594]
MAQPGSKGAIELRLTDGAQLFNNLDPFPFRERDLSSEAEQYIVEWAEELPKKQPIEIVVHLQSAGSAPDPAAYIPAAITGWFRARERDQARAIRQLFRDGRLAFLIGLAGLALCMALVWLLTQTFEGPFTRVIQESLVIVGWVVMWRPAEMFLYDWLPLLRQKTLFRRLADATVTVRTG